jgi:hypothetical protein
MNIVIKPSIGYINKFFPTRWDEVPFHQFLDIDDCGDDYVKLFALFTGLEEEVVRKASIEKLDDVIEMLGFLKTKVPTPLPKTICGYTIPKDLGFETVGQFSDLREDLKNSNNLTPRQTIEKYTLYCAIYACKEKFGEYDWKKAESMRDEFMNAPVTEVLAVGNFTLLKLIALKNNTRPNFQPRHTLRTKLKRAFLAFRLRTAFMALSFISKLRQPTERTNF